METDKLACPVCGANDIRLVRRSENVETFRVVRSASGDGMPTFVADPAVIDETRDRIEDRVECVNGHAHPARVGFTLEWVRPVSSP